MVHSNCSSDSWQTHMREYTYLITLFSRYLGRYYVCMIGMSLFTDGIRNHVDCILC